MILWELWRFITPGLHPQREALRHPLRRLVDRCSSRSGRSWPSSPSPTPCSSSQNVGGPSLQQIYDPNKYLGLIVALMAVFGLTFEFPVVLVSLELVGVLSPRQAGVVAALGHRADRGVRGGRSRPSGDPFSMLALAVPLYVFYEVSILIGKFLRR